jgi:PDZ domain
MGFPRTIGPACVLLLLTIAGCGTNPYKQYYQASQWVSPQYLSERRVAPPPDRSELLRGNDPKTDIEALAADGYVVIGTSSFNGPQGDESKVLEQAKEVGAERVLIYGKYTNTIQTAMPLTLPNTQTSLTTGSATAFGTGGTATAYGSAMTTTYGTQTTYVPITINRYDYAAVYLAKVRFAFGGNFRNLNAEESQQIGSVNGVAVVAVVHGSPAAAAGFVPGDIVTKVDGRAVPDQIQFNELLKQRQGQAVVFTVNRGGKTFERKVTLANF